MKSYESKVVVVNNGKQERIIIREHPVDKDEAPGAPLLLTLTQGEDGANPASIQNIWIDRSEIPDLIKGLREFTVKVK